MSKATPERPQYGVCLPCKVMGVIAADELLIRVPKYHEFKLILIDCVAPPQTLSSNEFRTVYQINPDSMTARDKAHELIGAAKELAAWIPQPARDEGWIRHLSTSERHAGFLYLDKARTLNDELVAAGVCKMPRQSWASLRP